jgi:hypothetical protein
MKLKNVLQPGRKLLYIPLIVCFISFFSSCKKESGTAINRTIEQKTVYYLPNYSQILNKDLKQIAYTILTLRKRGLDKN